MDSMFHHLIAHYIPYCDLLDALGYGQVFGHGPAQFVNGLADFLAHIAVNSNGLIFVAYVLTA